MTRTIRDVVTLSRVFSAVVLLIFCLLESGLLVQRVQAGLVESSGELKFGNQIVREFANQEDREERQLRPSRRQNSSRLFFDEFLSLFTGGGSSDDDEVESSLRNCSCNCGVSNSETRIVGGQVTGIHRYPWVARLVYDGQFHCGGSLLNGDYVLTAAHCVRRLRRSKFRVVLGDHDQYSTTEATSVTRQVAAIIRHKNFDGQSYNHDIALLKLRRPVTFSKQVRPVCLPSAGTDPAGKTGTVVGWGRTSEGGSIPATVMEVQVPIYTLTECRAMQYKPARISPYMLCAGQGSKDSCQGDSGGPLLVQNGNKYEVQGIVSWGVGCGRPGYPGVYTRVARYLEWVKRNMRDTCVCTS